MNLKGKRAIVTGAGSGIGAAIAARLAADGARVIVSDLKNAAQAGFFRADVSNEQQVSALVDFAVRELGGLDAMVNNAGIGEAQAPIERRGRRMRRTGQETHCGNTACVRSLDGPAPLRHAAGMGAAWRDLAELAA